MVDDHTQRPFRANEQPGASAKPGAKPGANPAANSSSAKNAGSDPLAELARLIGQSDPFSEFGRDNGRRAAPPPPPPEPAPQWEPAAPAPAYDPPGYFQAAPAAPAPNFTRQPFGGAPLSGDAEIYSAEQGVSGYAEPHVTQTTVPGYDDDPYRAADAHLGPADDDYYDDVQPSRRRMGILVIAGIFALAVLGTAGAFGYRAVFGSSSSSVPPPVIKADTAPSKIVPATTKDPQSSKQITDRVNDKGIGEKLVSREEQPVDVKPIGGMPQAQDSSAAPSNNPSGTEPKKVRTIAIRPDQSGGMDASAAPAPAPAPASPPPRPAAPPAARPVAVTPPPRAVTADAEAEPTPAPAPRQTAPRVAPPVQQQAAASPSGNAPLSLSPDAPTRSAPVRAAPAQRAAAPAQSAPASSGGGGGYAVQVSSQRSEADAQAAFRSLQGKYPDQLGGKAPVIRRADLGAKGIYFRAMVGPFATGGEAGELCSSLKAAGGSCIVQKN